MHKAGVAQPAERGPCMAKVKTALVGDGAGARPRGAGATVDVAGERDRDYEFVPRLALARHAQKPRETRAN
jgi:hypothetical protein